MTELRLKIAGIACDGCAKRLQGVLAADPGVRSADVSFADGAATVRFNEHTVAEKAIQDLIRRAGFEPSPVE